MMKRLISLLLVLCMVLVWLPVGALADVQPEPITATWVNPLYEDVYVPGSVTVTSPKEVRNSSDVIYYTDPAAAALEARAAMEGRVKEFSIGFQIPFEMYTDEGLGIIASSIMILAAAHTGVPTQGDYLEWQYGGAGFSAQGIDYNDDKTGYNSLITFYVDYYTTAAQEAEVTQRVEQLMNELNPTGTDYEKLTTVYDWICDNVVYDYDHLPDPTYTTQYTAYGALINGTSVCQGYALLLYRMALMMGIDCRVITGIGITPEESGAHAWNILKLDGKYYNADATWDINYAENDDYAYYLLSEENFGTDHIRDEWYTSAEFTAAYPMGNSDYEPSEPSVPSVPSESAAVINVIAAQYGNQTARWWEEFEAIYEEQNPNVDLVVDVVSWNDIYTVVNTRIANGEAPDILNLDSFAEYQADGLLLPVKSYISESTYAKFYVDFLDQSMIDSTVWAVPDLASARAMYYNKDILEAVGAEVPTTWPELFDACELIKNHYGDAVIPWGLDVSANEGQAAFGLYTWNCGNGGFIDENGNWALNSDANKEIICAAYEMYQLGWTNGTDLSRYDIQSLFDAGQVAMTIAPDSFAFEIEGSDNVINYGIAPIPTTGTESTSVGVMDRMMCFDNSYSAEELAAVTAFFDLFYDDERYLEWVQIEGFLPATSTAAALLAEQDPARAVWEDVLANCEFYPTGKPEWRDVRVGVIDVFEQAFAGGDVGCLLDELQARITGVPVPVYKTELSVLAPWYGGQSRDWWAQFEVDFEAAHEDIDLILDTVSWNEIYNEINARIESGNTPDILNIDSFAEYQAGGMLLPVEAYMSESTYAKFYRGFLDQSKADGKIWAVPDLTSAETLYYNADLFAELGLEAPSTWDDVLEACAAIKAAKGDTVIPWGMDVGNVNGQAAFAFYTWANGGGFVDDADNWALNSAENVEAIEYAVDLYNKGYANGTDMPVYELEGRFAQGEVAMMITSGTAWLEGMNYGVALIPANEGKTSSSIGIMDRMMCFDNDYTEEELAAVTAFFDFFYDDERHVGWTQMEGFLPATATGAALLAEMDPSMAVWEDALASCKFYPADKAEWMDVRNGVIDVFAQAFQGGDVQRLLDELQARITGVSIVEPGDTDGDGIVDSNDVARLLWYTLFEDSVEINGDADFNHDGVVDDKDVAYLLWHTLFPEDFPLS